MPRNFKLPFTLNVKDPRFAMRAIIGVLLVANLAAAIVAFKPFGGSAEDLRRQQDSLRAQVTRAQQQLKASRELVGKVEKALPHNVRIIQIHPTVDSRNRVTLDMQVGAESPEPVIKMFQTMAQAPFAKPDLKLQQTPTQAEPLYRYRVSVEYAQKL